MIKAKKILLTVGKVFTILGIIVAAVLACWFLIAMLMNTISLIRYTATFGFDENILVHIFSLISGCVYILFCALALVLDIVTLSVIGKLANAASKEQAKKASIALIVFSVLTDNIFCLIAAVFGIITCGKEFAAIAAEEDTEEPARQAE